VSELVPIRLIPVEVFGAEDGYGLSDAVSAWSDCNRARGRIYRVDDIPGRDEGDTVTVYVAASDLPWFERRFGDDFLQPLTTPPTPGSEPTMPDVSESEGGRMGA
jgi:hypothetical protein